jgi:tetratricopeptide (TPR) repeat protein
MFVPQMKNREKPRIKKLGTAQMPPVNTAPSNEQGDKYALLLFYAAQSLSVILVVGGIAFSSINMMRALNAKPLDWQLCIWMTVALAFTFIFARSLSWLGVLGSVLLASKMNAWQSQENICRKAQKMGKIMPSGAAWGAMVLSQSLATRGKYKETIEVAEAEWARNGSSDKNDQTVGPTCATASFASQMEGDLKNAMLWNERTIETLGRAMENMKKPKKSLMAKAMSAQSGNYVGQVAMQVGAAYFGNANICFQQNNKRQAKENYRKAIEYLNQSPDSPQKAEILKVAKDQMAQLKHS